MLETNCQPTSVEMKNNSAINNASDIEIPLFTLREQSTSPQQISDLEWRIKFTQMKLNMWRNLENDRWSHLEKLRDCAKAELLQLARVYP